MSERYYVEEVCYYVIIDSLTGDVVTDDNEDEIEFACEYNAKEYIKNDIEEQE